MKKRITFFLICLLLFAFGCSAFAEEAPAGTDGAAQGGYESYDDDWFNNGYEGIENTPPDGDSEERALPPRWYQRFSIVPVVIGLLVGAGVVFVFFQRSRSEAPAPGPYELRPEIDVAEQRDRLANVKRTTRDLSAKHTSD